MAQRLGTDVLHDPRQTGSLEQLPCRRDEFLVTGLIPAPARHVRVGLTRRRGMNGIPVLDEPARGTEYKELLERIRFNELERIVRLGLDVHAHHVEASAVVADSCTASAAEEIEQPRPHVILPPDMKALFHVGQP